MSRRRRPISSRPRARRELRRAHRLMENGDYHNAAVIFERIARSAHDRGLIRQAPKLYLLAGKAYTLAGDPDQGSEILWQGLQIIAEAKRWHILHQAGQRVIDELSQWGHEQLAQEFEIWLKDTLPEHRRIYQQNKDTFKGPQLPLQCPSCGGPIRPDEVEWLDRTTGECPYCGSSLRGT